MSARGLSRQLLRTGRQAGRRAEAGRIRFVALLLATVAVAVGLASLVAVHATYEGQAARGFARTPVLKEDAPGRPARALWSVANDSVAGSGPFTLQFIVPLTADAPLPPGVRAWPGPGEAVLSPALREHTADGLAARYGRVVGTIERSALQSPDELLAYVRPARVPAGQGGKPIVGYGPENGPVSYFLGQTDYAKAEWTFQVMPLLLLLLPAFVLLTVAARSGAHQRDRRTALIEVLGGTRRDRAWVVLGEALAPAAVGALVALGAVALSCAVDLRLPWTGHVVVASDLADRWWALVSAVLAAVFAVLAVVVLSDRFGRRRRAGGNRPRGVRRSPLRWAVACPVLLLIAVRGPDLLEPGTTGYVMTNWVGVAGTLATLPAAIAVVTAALGRVLGRAGHRWGRPGLLVAGRRAAAHPGPVARMTAGVVVALGLLLQVVAWQGQFGEAARAAEATVERIGESALVVRPRTATAVQLAEFTRALPSDTQMVALTVSPEEGTVTLRGRCPVLRTLRVGCPGSPTVLDGVPDDPRLRELLGWYGGPGGKVTVEQADPVDQRAAEGGLTQTALVSRSGGDLSVADTKQLAYRLLPFGADVDTIGGEWLTAASVNGLQGRWITLFGLCGITVLGAAAALSSLAEFLRQGRALAPLTSLAGNHRVYWSTAAFTIFVPFALAGLAGCTIGVWLAFPKTAGGASYITDSLLAECTLAVAAIGLGAWVWASSSSVRQAAAWRPRGE
ncbi:FtsX-like permease family protein [Streptomyces sp. NPDC089919]|uniref:FtsX-like permease family protein n=1 Tax=Streptomyces sp. NPDC089919 TaxID=3155188 RepID=UPI003449A904